jgi:hypothetical protein
LKLLVDFVLIGIIVGFISHGNFRNLKQANIPYLWLIVLGFVVKFIGPYFSESSFQWFNIIGMIIVFIGTLFSYKSYGMKIVSVGAFLNILVIVFNRGMMPVWLPMVQRLQLNDLAAHLESGLYLDYTLLKASTRLPFLGDTLPYYSIIMRRPFVISIGDYLLGIGLIAFIIFYMRKEYPS